MRTRRSAVLWFVGLILFLQAGVSSSAAVQEQDDSTAAAFDQRPRNVLLLNSYNVGYPWTDALVSSILSSLKKFPVEVQVWTEYLDAKRSHIQDSNYLIAYLAEKYQPTHFDLIISTDDAALLFLLDHRESLFGDVPVVFGGVNDLGLIRQLPRRVYTGVEEVFDSVPILDLALKLHPSTSRVVVVSDNSLTGRAQKETYEEAARDRKGLLFEFLDGTELTFDEILTRLEQLPARTLVLTTGFTKDASNLYIPAERAHRLIAETSPVPVYSPSISDLGQGIVGGSENGGFEHGRLVGQIALQVLGGTLPGEIPIADDAENHYVFDARRLKDLGINLSLIPPSSRIVNRFPSIYSEYARFFWLGLGILGLQSGVIILLAVNIGRRRRAEKEVRLATRRIQNFVSASPLGVHLYQLQDDDRLVFVGANPAADRILGVDNSQFIGKTIEEAFPELAESDVPRGYRETAIGGRPWQAEQVLYDDEAISGAFQVTAFQTWPGEVAAMFLDVTERRKAQEALRESEERLRLAARSSRVGVWEYETGGDRFDWDDLTFELYGVDPAHSDLSLAGWERLIHDEDLDRVREEFRTSLRDALQPFDLEFRIVRGRDGSVRHIRCLAGVIRDSAGKPVRAIGTTWDFTERKLAEEALRFSENRFRSVIEQANGAIYILFDKRFDLVNRRFCELTGVTPEEARAEDFSFWSLLAPESVPLIRERQEKRARGEEVPDVYEFQIQSRSGKRVHVEASVTEIEYRDGKAILGILRDVTEHRNLELQLSQAQKMESIGRLSGGVAHDLNNLLTPIIGYAEMLSDDTSESSSARDSAGEIVKAAFRARDLVRQLLAFSRRQTLEFRSIDLGKMILEFEKLLRRAVRENISIELRLAPSLPTIRGDRGQLEQVIMNLVVNAQDAMPEGGILWIETGVIDLDEAYAGRHTAVTPGRHVLLSVSDTGHGMDAETRSRVFEPFFTTKETGQGTGLGLATVYGIVKQHGGNIWVYSEPGDGTTFKCYFPAVDIPETGGEVSAEVPTDLGGSETIMIVEDEIQVRELAATILRRRGYSVLEAEDGSKCLKLLSRHDGPVDLLLTDVVLPGLGGTEIYREVLRQYPRLRVLYMSGYTQDRVSKRGVLDDGLAFIQKPFSTQALAEKVRQVLEKAQETEM